PDEAALAARLDAEDREPFDLARGPLLRAKLPRLAPDDHTLSLTAHHIACDGWAYDILLRELAASYSAISRGRPPALPPPASFRDYAARQADWLDTPDAAAVDAWWRSRFADPPPPLELPAHRPPPADRSYRG